MTSETRASGARCCCPVTGTPPINAVATRGSVSACVCAFPWRINHCVCSRRGCQTTTFYGEHRVFTSHLDARCHPSVTHVLGYRNTGYNEALCTTPRPASQRNTWPHAESHKKSDLSVEFFFLKGTNIVPCMCRQENAGQATVRRRPPVLGGAGGNGAKMPCFQVNSAASL